MKLKNITLCIAAMLAANVNLNAQFANPKDADGNVIVKYDLEKGAFAESNDFEIDQTVVIAVDVTGTPLETFVNTPPRDPDVTRSIAFAFYSTNILGEDDSKPASLDGRFQKIKDNIYGATINFYQFGTSRFLDGWFGPNADYTVYKSTTVGEATEFNADIFGFGFKEGNSGAEWWQEPQQGFLNFTTEAYTGTKTSPEFFKGDTDDADFFPGEFEDWAGYAAPGKAPTSIAGHAVSDSPVVVYEYYNMLGQKLSTPTKGFYIEKAIKADGSFESNKMLR